MQILKLPFLLILFIAGLAAGCTGQLIDPPSSAEAIDPGLIADEEIPLGLSLITFKGGEAVRGGETHSVVWHIKTDPSYTEMDPGFYVCSLQISKDGGATWETPTAAESIPGFSDQNISYQWSVPLSAEWEGSQFKVRVKVKNTKGNIHTVTSETFAIDNEAPLITPGTLKLNNYTYSDDNPFYQTRSANVNISFNATDALSPINGVCFKQMPLTPADDDACWKPFSILNLVPDKNMQVSGLSQFLGFVGGSYSLYFWVRDLAGNISNLTYDVGTSSYGDPNIDKAVIQYSPGNTVSFSKFTAANTSTAGRLPELTETRINASNPVVFLQWKIDVEGGSLLAADSPLSLEYTLNDRSYTAFPESITGPMNALGTNGACSSLAPDATGCVGFNIPSELHGVYFRLRLRVKDEGNFIYTVASNALNTGNLLVLAGNTDTGIDGAGSQAVFNNNGGSTFEAGDSGSLVVADSGRIFIKDPVQGVLTINPDNGLMSSYIPLSSTSIDGEIGIATTANLLKIAIDYQGHLLLMESDRLRKVTTSKINGVDVSRVDIIVGGGSTTNTNTSGIAARSFQMSVSGGYAYSSITPLPDGAIYFVQNASNTYTTTTDIRVFKPVQNKVYPVPLSGKGVRGEPYRALTDLRMRSAPGISFNPLTAFVTAMTTRWCLPVPGDCSWFSSNFNPRSGVANGTGTHYAHAFSHENHSYITSRRGELFVISPNSGLYKLNVSSQTWTRVVGNGKSGSCPDGTLATACPTDMTDAFVTADNIIFFLDRGQVRAVGSDNRVITIFGQSRSKGDGGDPLLARFSGVRYLDTWGSDVIMVYDYNEKVLREFTPGGTITTIAGNRGTSPAITWNADKSSTGPSTVGALDPSYWTNDTGFNVDTVSGEPVVHVASSLAKLVRDPLDANFGRWIRLIGGGSNTVNAVTSNCDNTAGNCNLTGAYPISVRGYIPAREVDGTNLPGSVIVSTFSRGSGNMDSRCYQKAVQVTDGYVQHLMGNGGDCNGTNGTSIDYPVDGIQMSGSSSFPVNPGHLNSAVYREADDSILMARFETKRIVKTPLVRAATTKTIIGAGVTSTYVETLQPQVSFTPIFDGGIEYLVYCDRNGALNRMRVSDANNVILPLPISSLRCAGRSMKVSPDGRSVIFTFTQNGMAGIGRYDVFEVSP